MSQITRKKKVKKQNTANTIDELIEDINQNNITQSEVIQKIILDDDFNELIRNSPIEEKNKLAEALINTTYFKALRLLKNEYSDIEIFKIMDDIMTYEYIRMLYILNKQRVDDLDIIDMINQGSLEGLTYAYNNGFIVVEKDMIEDAKIAYSKDDSETKLTIYNLLTQIYKDNQPLIEAEEKRTEFCQYNEIIPAIIYKSTSIILPYLQVLPKEFDIDLLFDPVNPVRKNAFIQFDQTSYLGGLPSIFSKDKTEDFIIDRDWIISSNNYILNLSLEDKFTVYGYTHNGDVIVNMILRNNEKDIRDYILNPERITDRRYQPLFFHLRKVLSTKDYGIKDNVLDMMLSDDFFVSYKALCKNQTFKEMIPEEAYIDAAKMFLEELLRIVNNSPPIQQKTVVYRGSRTLYYSTTNRKTFKNNTFMSTSYGIWGARSFADTRNKKCCMKRIILNPGTKALFMDCITQYESETEILLPPDNEFKIISHEINSYYDMPTIEKFEEDTIIDNFCLGQKTYMTVTHMEQI